MRTASTRRTRPSRSTGVKRRRLAAITMLLLAAGSVAAFWHGGTTSAGAPGADRARVTPTLRLLLGATEIATVPRDASRPELIRIIRRTGTARRVVRRDRGITTYRVNAAATAERARSASSRMVSLQVERSVIASFIRAPVIAQALRNNCESAALSILLATRGVRVAQLALQAGLPRSGPVDPTDEAGIRVWGDPERGFVGRADGGGTAGGFGVYPGPVAALARRRGVALQTLTGRTPSSIYRQLRAGHAVMAWIGLTDGPYGEWQSPGGRTVKVNFGEHTVVLNGIRQDGSLRVVNPLRGTTEIWSAARFEMLWNRLGRRALAT